MTDHDWMAPFGLDPALASPDQQVSLAPLHLAHARSSTPEVSLGTLVAEGYAFSEALTITGFRAWTFLDAPQVVFVELEADEVVGHIGDVKSASPREWALDGRKSVAVLHVRRADGSEALLVAKAAVVEVYNLATIRPVEPGPSVPPLPWRALLQDTELEPWLSERLKELMGPSPFMQAAAAGAFARGWAPVDRDAALQHLLSGDRGPVDQVRRWARDLDEPMRAAVVQGALDAVVACRESLDDLAKAVIEGSTRPAILAWHRLVEHRDRLASAAWVLVITEGPQHGLRQDLDHLDEEVQVRWSERPSQPAEPELRWLHEMAAREPDAWWLDAWWSDGAESS